MSDKRQDTFRVCTDAGHVIYLTRYHDDSFLVCVVTDDDKTVSIGLTQADIAQLNAAIHADDEK